jgi:hypothetical protein
MDWAGRRADSGGLAETGRTIDPTWNNQVRHVMAHGSWRASDCQHCRARDAHHGGAEKWLRGRESHQVQAKHATPARERGKRGNPPLAVGENRRDPRQIGGRGGAERGGMR